MFGFNRPENYQWNQTELLPVGFLLIARCHNERLSRVNLKYFLTSPSWRYAISNHLIFLETNEFPQSFHRKINYPPPNWGVSGASNLPGSAKFACDVRCRLENAYNFLSVLNPDHFVAPAAKITSSSSSGLSDAWLKLEQDYTFTAYL